MSWSIGSQQAGQIIVILHIANFLQYHTEIY